MLTDSGLAQIDRARPVILLVASQKAIRISRSASCPTLVNIQDYEAFDKRRHWCAQ